MAIPNVEVITNEVSLAGQNVVVPFLPAVLLKTKSGPIGAVTRVNSKAQLQEIFGKADATVPAQFALEKYLDEYQYAYITRIANKDSAKEGTAEVTFEADSNPVKMFSVKTKYKTDTENGKQVKLVYDDESKKIYIDLTDIMGRNMTSIKENIDVGDLKSAVYDEDHKLIGGLEFILDKLVKSANAITGSPVILTNEFESKTGDEAVPTVQQFTEGFIGYIQSGDSGNSVAASNADVLDYIDLYNYQDYPIDEMVIPEYNTPEVINYAVEKARTEFFRVIANATGATVSDMQTSVQNFAADDRGTLEVYAPNVYYSDLVDADGNMVPCPASIAVLNAYALCSRTTPWEAVAGYRTGILPNVAGLSVKLSRQNMDDLYDGVVPINPINYISSIGYVVWGNKTTVTEPTTRFFDRVNISRLVNYLTRELTQSSWEFMFQPITLTLFTEFKAKLNDICAIVKDSGGLDDYLVVCNSSNNTSESIARNELHAEVQIKPTESLEYVRIGLTVTDTIVADVTESEGGAN